MQNIHNTLPVDTTVKEKSPLTFVGPAPKLPPLPGVQTEAAGPNALRFKVSGGIGALITALAEHPIATLTSREPSLEEIFLHHYDRSAGGVTDPDDAPGLRGHRPGRHGVRPRIDRVGARHTRRGTHRACERASRQLRQMPPTAAVTTATVVPTKQEAYVPALFVDTAQDSRTGRATVTGPTR